MKALLILPLLLLLLGACTQKSNSTAINSIEFEQPIYAQLFHFEKNSQNEIELVVNDADTGNEIFRSTALDHPKTIVLSTTHIGSLQALNQLQLIIGCPSLNFVANTNLKARKDSLIQINNESELPLEKIFYSKAQLFIHSAYTPELNQHKLLSDKNIISLPNQDWKETSPLARAEWVKAIGFLIGEYERAKEVYQNIEKNYLFLKQEAAKLPYSKTAICGNIYADYWNTPAKDSYAAQLLRDAKIDYRYKDVGGKTTLSLTLEQVIAENTQSFIWINPGLASKKELLQSNPKAYLIPAFEKDAIYCYSHNNNYYWENSLVYPDRILSDLIQIAHPNQSIVTDRLYFYQKVK